MSELIKKSELTALWAELAALRRENEILHKWLEEQSKQNSELRQILLNRGDAK